MAKNKAEKNKALVFKNETDDTTPEANDISNRTTYDHSRVPEHRRRADGRAVKSNGVPYTPGVGNPNHAHVPAEERCKARKSNGDPCQKLPIKGAEVCGTHGGKSPHVMRAAMARLQNASDKMVQQLLAIAMSDEEPTAVRLAAIREALDRAGIKSKDKLDITHEMKPWEKTEQKMIEKGGRRAEDPVFAAAEERADEAYWERFAAEMGDERY